MSGWPLTSAAGAMIAIDRHPLMKLKIASIQRASGRVTIEAKRKRTIRPWRIAARWPPIGP